MRPPAPLPRTARIARQAILRHHTALRLDAPHRREEDTRARPAPGARHELPPLLLLPPTPQKTPRVEVYFRANHFETRALLLQKRRNKGEWLSGLWV